MRVLITGGAWLGMDGICRGGDRCDWARELGGRDVRAKLRVWCKRSGCLARAPRVQGPKHESTWQRIGFPKFLLDTTVPRYPRP